MKNILISAAGRRVNLVKSFQAELHALDKDAKVYASDMNPTLSSACHQADAYIQVKAIKDPAYINDLLAKCIAFNIGVIVPTIDTELTLLADNKELFIENGITPIVSGLSFTKACRDKRLINTFFEERGISIPKPIDKNNPSFPLFIKPYDGSLSADIFLINTPEELTNYHLSNPKLMFMEYVDKKQYDEFTVDMYYGTDHNVKCIVPRKRIEIRGGEISKGITLKNDIVDYLKEKLNHIDSAVGCLTLQLFRHKENANKIGIEINPRFGGGYPLSYKAGANYPLFIIKEYLLNETLSYTNNWEENLLMLRYDDEIIIHDARF